MFHFDVLFSNGSRGYFFEYKLVNIWLDKITLLFLLAFSPSLPPPALVQKNETHPKAFSGHFLPPSSTEHT